MPNLNTKILQFKEREQIEKLIKQGLSCAEIAKNIGRSKNCIVTEIRRAGKTEYSAITGQNLSDKIKEEKYKKISMKQKGNQKQYFLKQRVENLEMQVEILHEAIKELMNR